MLTINQNTTSIARSRMRSAIVLLLALCAAPIVAQGTLTPVPQIVFLDNSGNPINNAKICTYAAGTTTPQATYYNPDLDISHVNANPIRTDSSGRPTTGGIYLSPTSYKFVVLTAGTDNTCSTGTTIYTQDNVSAVPATAVGLDITGTAGATIAAGNAVYLSNGSGATTTGRWYPADSTNTYSSSTATEVGIATAAIATGASGTIRVGGRMTGLSGLTAGTDYYAGAAGALTSTPPANARFIGRADSTTTLIMTGGAGALSTPDSDGTNRLVIKTTSNLTADRLFTLVPGDAARTLTMSGDATLNQDVSTAGSPTFVGATLSAATTGTPTLALSNATTGALARLFATNAKGIELDVNGTGQAIATSDNTGFQGLRFATTQSPSSDANTLDDYKEGLTNGSWTPVIGGSGGTTGQMYAGQNGAFIKIGRLMIAWFAVTLSTKGTITTNVQIQGLPCTSATIVNGEGIAALRFDSLGTNWVNVVGSVRSNSTAADVLGAAAATTTNGTNLVTADITNNTLFGGTFIYPCAN